MMAQLLTLEGFDAEVASDGREALDLLRFPELRPHLIVLDMMMPRMNGWAFRRHQNNDPAIADIPVVIVSAVPPDQLDAVSAAAIVPKPCDYDRLVRTVRAHC